MSARNTIVRSMHDLGLAAWFGGALMGAVGLNGAAALAQDPAERLSLSSTGWARWAPVQIAAILTHGIGGVGLILGNKTRLAGQPEARRNTIVKLAVTALAGGASVYAGALGATIWAHADEGGDGVTEPAETASHVLASAQKQQRIVQWVIPALTGILIVLGAQQGEQQRPAAGLLRSLGIR
ncbi:hypothetical protein FHS07_000896 [Microbacterium proteolyticum]|uniref:Uncharacterized protein n=1 Tax=Microbacterium proteolyticum TaxID=1572644 RepID=A0A7W5GFG7_9MICO|nr:hypothetical protein [Microbacterium proteolyticum]MBB3157212.1 hypothetical protein [Microbacterium proteolyticum]